MSEILCDLKLINLLTDLSSVCVKFGVNGFSIEENIKGKMIRGMGNKGKGMSPLVLCHPITDTLPFQALAISNIAKLNAALNVFKGAKVVPTITLTLDPKSNIVRSFDIKSGKVKLKFSCANPAAIDSPKGVNDVPTYKVLFDEESSKVLSSGVKAIELDASSQAYVSIVSDGTLTKFIISGMSKDEFTYELPNSSNIHTGVHEAFTFKYPVSSLIHFLSMSDQQSIIIGKRGVITNTLNGYTYNLFPII